MNRSIFSSVKFAAIGLVSLAMLSACKKDKMPAIDPMPKSTAGVYVLCEGAFGQPNNSSITYYDIASKTVEKNYFKTKNGVELGTDANDLKQYGSKLYCVVTGSNEVANDAYVEVISVTTGKSLKRIPFSNGTTDFHPRYVVFSKNKAYVSSYNGTISRIDTTGLTIESSLKVGGALEGMAVVGNKLYVANSSHPFHVDPKNSSVSVVDLTTFSNKADIPVSFNPTKLVAVPNGDLLVITSGQFKPAIDPVLEKINTLTDSRTQTFEVVITSLAIGANRSIAITSSYPDPAELLSLNIGTGVLGSSFITSNTEIRSIYSVAINPLDNNVFVSDATDYTGDGRVLCFDGEGKIKFEFATGTVPKAVAFNYSFK